MVRPDSTLVVSEVVRARIRVSQKKEKIDQSQRSELNTTKLRAALVSIAKAAVVAILSRASLQHTGANLHHPRLTGEKGRKAHRRQDQMISQLRNLCGRM